MNSNELRQINLLDTKSKIPTLEEMFYQVDSRVPILIEIKSGFNPIIEERLVEKTAASLGLFNQPDDYQLFTECNNMKDLGLAIEDDVVIMHNGKLEACFVAFPSSWNAGDKVGKSLAELHEPIADNEALVRASDGIIRAMCSGQSYERYTWGITSLGGYSNHPKYDKPEIKNLDDLFNTNSFDKSNYAYLINSVDYNIPAVINSLLNSKIKVSTALKPFRINTSNGLESFDNGSLVITAVSYTHLTLPTKA